MNNTNSKIIHIKTAKNYQEFGQHLEITNNSRLINTLFSVLSHILNKTDCRDKTVYEVVYKSISFIEKLTIDGDNLNRIKIIEKLTELKTKLIEKIKNVEKNKRINNEWIIFLRNIVNRLEKLELALLYNSVSETTLTNYNIISQIIFEEKELSHSNYLVSHYPYIINVFNITGENILNLLVDKYLSALDEYTKYHRNKVDLFYYENIIRAIIKNNKIKTPEDVIDQNIEKIVKLPSNNSKMYNLWLKHLINLLTKKEFPLTEEEIDYMYNINTNKINNPEIFIFNSMPSLKPLNNYVITIDDASTIDRDDALAISLLSNGHYELKIIIADPSYYFDIHSKVMQEARKKGESIYYTKLTKHIFPEAVITNYLSLDQNKMRPARIYCYELDQDANVIDFRIVKTSVVVNNNLTYDKINQFIKHGTNNHNLDRTLMLLLSLESALSKKYHNVNGDEKVTGSTSSSENLIAKFMVFNNHYVANYFKEHNLPFVYRAHTLHKELNSFHDSIANLRTDDKAELEKVITSLEKISMTSFYTTVPKNHDGLELECYGFTTSPIRRFADDLAGYCEDNFYFKKITDQESYRIITYLNSTIKTLNERHIEIVEHYKKRVKMQ